MIAVEAAIAAIIFVVTVLAIVSRSIDETVAALIGLVLMILLTRYSVYEAFESIDWNVIAILLGMWTITAYMVEGGFAERVVAVIAKRVKDYRVFLLALMLLAGFVSMFVDNVLVILLFGSIVLEAARRNGGNPILAILMIGFSANFMGTALLMGDLPPQLLHSVAGAEFTDFIWSRGRPGSFPLLTLTFIVVSLLMYLAFIRNEPRSLTVDNNNKLEAWRKDILFISIVFFSATVAAMAIRPLIGLPLGFITITGASITALAVELYRRLKGEGPSFEDVANHIEWRALLFYAALFGIVGGLEENNVITIIAKQLIPFIEASSLTAYSVFYWSVASLSTIVEHDALLLTFLYVVRDAAHLAAVDPWPYYWAMAWSATLASNTTTAAAPALYVAVVMAEKQGYKVTGKTFLKYSIPYVIASLIVHYAISIPIWGITSS